jgi:hypothetical protein
MDGAADGPLSAPTIVAHVSGSNIQLRSLPGAQIDVRATYDAATRHAQVASARVQAPWGLLSANGELNVRGTRTSRLGAEVARLDVAAIMRGLNLKFVASTRVDGKLDAEWRGLDYLEASGAATAR